MEEQNSRFKGAPWFTNTFPKVFIGGAGGIGSWLSFFLSRIGFRVTLRDFDTIESHNIGGQLFRSEDIGKYKVHALAEVIRDFTGKNIDTQVGTVHHNSSIGYVLKYCFSAFDNMQARQDLFDLWVRNLSRLSETELSEAIFIDGRLEAEQLQIFCVTADRINEYKKFLFNDGEAESAPCTMKQTSHSASLIGSLMTAFLTNHFTNVLHKDNIREVPFFYEFFIPLNITEHEPTE